MRGLGRAVAIGSFLLQGCALLPVEREPVSHPGRFSAVRGQPGVVIGAPHGSTDELTDRIAAELARRTGFGLVVATGYADMGDGGRRVNVNRPTESALGGPSAEEEYTEAARRVYEAYEGRVREVSNGPLKLYVEIHGNSRRESAGRIEVATAGVSRTDAWRLKTLFEMIRDAHLRGRPQKLRLDVWVEPLDPIYWAASAAKRIGALRIAETAIHIELPRAARIEGGEAYTEILAEFLRESSRLLLAKEK